MIKQTKESIVAVFYFVLQIHFTGVSAIFALKRRLNEKLADASNVFDGFEFVNGK